MMMKSFLFSALLFTAPVAALASGMPAGFSVDGNGALPGVTASTGISVTPLLVTDPEAQISPMVRAGALELSGAYTRATPPNAPVAGAYLEITNTGTSEDRLIGGSSPVAEHVEIHEMAMQDNVMKMRELPDGLPIPAGESVTLAPGGYHVMMIGLADQLKEGDMIGLTLNFASGEEADLLLPVVGRGMHSNGHGMSGGMEPGEMKGTE